MNYFTQFNILMLMQGEFYGDLWNSFSVQLPLICLLNSVRLSFSVCTSLPCTACLVYKVLPDRNMKGEYNSPQPFSFLSSLMPVVSYLKTLFNLSIQLSIVQRRRASLVSVILYDPKKDMFYVIVSINEVISPSRRHSLCIYITSITF